VSRLAQFTALVMMAEWLEAQPLLFRVVSWSVRSGAVLGNPTKVLVTFFYDFGKTDSGIFFKN